MIKSLLSHISCHTLLKSFIQYGYWLHHTAHLFTCRQAVWCSHHHQTLIHTSNIILITQRYILSNNSNLNSTQCHITYGHNNNKKKLAQILQKHLFPPTQPNPTIQQTTSRPTQPQNGHFLPPRKSIVHRNSSYKSLQHLYADRLCPPLHKSLSACHTQTMSSPQSAARWAPTRVCEVGKLQEEVGHLAPSVRRTVSNSECPPSKTTNNNNTTTTTTTSLSLVVRRKYLFRCVIYEIVCTLLNGQRLVRKHTKTQRSVNFGKFR